MTSLVDIHVKEGSLARLTCPDTDCKEPLPPNIIKDLLAPEQFQRWVSARLPSFLLRGISALWLLRRVRSDDSLNEGSIRTLLVGGFSSREKSLH